MQTFLDLLARQHQERSTAPAILAPGREPLTYAALRSAIDRAGDALAVLGCSRGTRVAVALPDGPDAALAMLAAMIWTTCAPLNPRLGPDACIGLFAQLRIDALILEDHDASPLLEAARAASVRVIHLAVGTHAGAELFALRPESPAAPVVRIPPQPDDVALVVHTSGTTGQPKVVAITQRQLVRTGREPLPIEANDRCLCVSPLYTTSGFGFGVTAPIIAGASTVITEGFEIARFFDWLEAFRPTYFSASPTVHAAIIAELRQRRRSLPASLRFVRSSSSGMSASMQEELETLLGVPVIQGYGSTEAGLIALDSLAPGRRRPGSVGTACDTEILIADDSGARVPAGTVGEILVRGPGVMRGYENDPAANRRAFHEGWFRTRDLGYLDADGYLFVMGRIDELINRGGLKVAPAEVDAVFLRHPAVADAATVGVPHPSLGQEVVTAVVVRQGEAVTAQQLREYALQHMTPSKIPSSIVLVGELPRNASGKVQRGLLADALGRKARDAEFVPPRDAEEEMVAGIFATLLNLPRVGALDNFFDLGGDSLLGMQVLSRVGAEMGVVMEELALFEAPTVEQFARRLRTMNRDIPVEAGDRAPTVRRTRRLTGSS